MPAKIKTIHDLVEMVSEAEFLGDSTKELMLKAVRLAYSFGVEESL